MDRGLPLSTFFLRLQHEVSTHLDGIRKGSFLVNVAQFTGDRENGLFSFSPRDTRCAPRERKPRAILAQVVSIGIVS